MGKSHGPLMGMGLLNFHRKKMLIRR